MIKSQEVNLKYFIYARKSSESEERQARSIEDQLSIMWQMAYQNGYKVVAEFTESRSGRKLGRPVFNEMMKKIEAGEANAILAWHPDRLARNSVDGGQIMYLLDNSILETLTFANFWFDNTSQGKFNLNMAFAQSKYYTDNLSENVKRGLTQLVARGVYPSKAKRGYLNNPRTRVIDVNPQVAPVIKKMFEHYAQGNISLDRIGYFFKSEFGLTSKNGTALSISRIQSILTDPFYYGVFIYNGESHQGIHEPIITKELFDQVQSVMVNRGKPKNGRKILKSFPLRGFMACCDCGCSITSETQKGHNYYHCTHHRRGFPCKQPMIREDRLAIQLKGVISRLDIPTDWLHLFLKEIDKLEFEGSNHLQPKLISLDKELKEVQAKLVKLVDLYLDGELDRADYVARKKELLDRKVAIFNGKQNLQNIHPKSRFELLRTPIKLVLELRNTNVGDDLIKLRNYVTKVGSNFRLKERKVLWDWTNPYENLANSARFSEWQYCWKGYLTCFDSNIECLNKSILPLHNPTKVLCIPSKLTKT